jgi:hypothetical protein
MCNRPYRCEPVPAYTAGPPAQLLHFHLVQTITITTTIDFDAFG